MFARTQLISHFFVYKQINRTQKSPLIRSFFLDKLCEPQTIAVVRHRWLFIIKNNDIRWLSLVSSMKKHTIWIIFPDDNLCMLLNICMFVYGLLWQISQWKWNALNHFKFPFDWRNQNIFWVFCSVFRCQNVRLFMKALYGKCIFLEPINYESHFSNSIRQLDFLLFDLWPSFQSLRSRSTH